MSEELDFITSENEDAQNVPTVIGGPEGEAEASEPTIEPATDIASAESFSDDGLDGEADEGADLGERDDYAEAIPEDGGPEPRADDGSVEEITDEELDKIADTAIAALGDILKYFDLGEVTIDEYEGDEGELILDITGDDLAVLIGRHGKTLDALQFLISSITARTIGYRYPVVVDVEGYKSRQRQKLESLALSSAKRALAQGRSVKLRPMTPYERRIVHIALRDFEGVETASEGEGNARHVVVLPE